MFISVRNMAKTTWEIARRTGGGDHRERWRRLKRKEVKLSKRREGLKAPGKCWQAIFLNNGAEHTRLLRGLLHVVVTIRERGDRAGVCLAGGKIKNARGGKYTPPKKTQKKKTGRRLGDTLCKHFLRKKRGKEQLKSSGGGFGRKRTRIRGVREKLQWVTLNNLRCVLEHCLDRKGG